MGFGENDEALALATAAAPARWNGNPVFFVNRVPELAGEEFLRLRVGVHASGVSSIPIHFQPLLTTALMKGQYKKYASF